MSRFTSRTVAKSRLVDILVMGVNLGLLMNVRRLRQMTRGSATTLREGVVLNAGNVMDLDMSSGNANKH